MGNERRRSRMVATTLHYLRGAGLVYLDGVNYAISDAGRAALANDRLGRASNKGR